MSIPKEIASAIIKTTREVGTLIKDEYNKHGGYPFVGIDAFYERVASKAASNGLSWVASEKSFDVVEVSGKQTTSMIRVTYDFTMFHESGATAEGFSTMTVLHAVQGAQTAGSALSYSVKNFMRQTFKLATGEKGSDADETDPRDLDEVRPTQKPANDPPRRDTKPDVKDVVDRREDGKPVFKEPTDGWSATMMRDIFVKFVDICETFEELKGFWNQNAAPLEALKRLDVEAYSVVRNAFTAHRQKLEKEKSNG